MKYAPRSTFAVRRYPVSRLAAELRLTGRLWAGGGAAALILLFLTR